MPNIESIEIIDVQIYEPFPGVALTDEQKPLLSMFQVELAREALEAIGVDMALAVTDDKFIEFAHGRYPGRFPGVHTFSHASKVLADCRRASGPRPSRDGGGPGAGSAISSTPSMRPEFEAGVFDPLYKAAEEVGLPIFNSTHGGCAKMAKICRAPSEPHADHRSYRRGAASGLAAGSDELEGVFPTCSRWRNIRTSA